MGPSAAVTGNSSYLRVPGSDSRPWLLGHVFPTVSDEWGPVRLREVWLPELPVQRALSEDTGTSDLYTSPLS